MSNWKSIQELKNFKMLWDSFSVALQCECGGNRFVDEHIMLSESGAVNRCSVCGRDYRLRVYIEVRE